MYQVNEEETCQHCHQKGLMWCICPRCEQLPLPDDNCSDCHGTGTQRHCPECGTLAQPTPDYE